MISRSRELTAETRDLILSIAERHGAHHVRVFGSVGRGKATENSDLDLLVEFESDRTLLDHSHLVLDLEAAFGCKVDVVTPQSLHWHIRDRVLREAVPL